MKRACIVAAASAFVFGLVACGSDGSQFANEGQNPADPGNGVPNGSGGLPEIGPKGTGSACVNQVIAAELAPTNLVFMYDKSGSMGDNVNSTFDPNLKWNPVNAGMKGFFADPYSSTVRASLQFFPMNDDTIQTTCAFSYATPQVALTMASDPAFVTTLDATKPEGGTPTLPALQGAIAYAHQVATDRPTDKTAVVLVTDGEPGFWDAGQNAFVPGCTDNDVAHVAAAAQASFQGTPSIPVYVVGVGPSLDKLNQVASAGGTGGALMVDVADPATTKTEIANALGKIRTQTVACDFSIPPAPAGQQLDPFSVNVVLTKGDGTQQVLSYSKTCGAADGWQYDNPSAPTKITLCSQACDEARASSQGKVSLAFGCKTQVAVQ